MLSKFVVAGAFGAIVALAAPAQAEEAKQRFTHEGYTYVYQVKETAEGVQRISGRRYPGAVAFNLAVKNGKVSGVSGGQAVGFKVEEAQGAAAE
ncbi:hypothetical protein [Sphingobium mellinum]|uniref:hypothetical protein n=1 Tax=Sphingobium mellinum TaxID=1387166 RepID=UPI0030EEF287